MKRARYSVLLGSMFFFASLTPTLAEPLAKDPNAPLSSIQFTPNGLVIVDEDGNVETMQGSVIIVDQDQAVTVDSDGNSIPPENNRTTNSSNKVISGNNTTSLSTSSSVTSFAPTANSSLASAILALSNLGISAAVVLSMDGVEESVDGKCYNETTLSGRTFCLESDPIPYPNTNGLCLHPDTAEKC